MSNYQPILYMQPLSRDCVRVLRELKARGVEVTTKDVLVSRRARGELQKLLDGSVRVPCLVLANTVIADREAILRYVRLRYGDKQDVITS